MQLELKRNEFTSTATIGELYIDGKKVADTLENPFRELKPTCPHTIKGEDCKCSEKVYGKTAIPPGQYFITYAISESKKVPLPRLQNVPHFLGILIHAGSTVEHTDGCILVGKRVSGKERLQDGLSISQEISKKIEDAFWGGDQISITITNGAGVANVLTKKKVETQAEQVKRIKEQTKTQFTYYTYHGRYGITTDMLYEMLKKDGIEQGLKMEEILDFMYQELTNYQRIEQKYTKEEYEKLKKDGDIKRPQYVKPETTIWLPSKKWKEIMSKIIGSDIFVDKSLSVDVYFNQRLKKLLEDDSYVPVNFSNGSDKNAHKNKFLTPFSVQQKFENIQIWVYSKALGKLIDISPIIESCSIQKNKEVGQFSIEVAPIYNLEQFGEMVHNQFAVMNNGKLNKDFISSIIQMNDVVFIRFEMLEVDITGEDKNKHKPIYNISPAMSELSTSKVWDMIGLVDSCSINVSTAKTVDYTIQIAGQDLTKLITEDGTWFLPIKFSEGSKDGWFYGGDPTSSWYKRNMITGEFDFFFSHDFQNIKNLLYFIFNYLSSIKIVDNNVFSACSVNVEKFDVQTQEHLVDEVQGIWRIIRLAIDEILEKRILCDYSFAKPEGTLKDLIGKVCQEPFVEFWGDTFGAEFNFVARQAPFTKRAIRSVVDGDLCLRISPNDVQNVSLEFDNRVYSWYQIMPQNSLMKQMGYLTLSEVPIVFLDEFVEVFGNKRCIINDIYLSELGLKGGGSDKSKLTFRQALLNDLAYIIETNAYLPFTRKGTITINGDRRIKIGTFVILELTGEIFYVTGVTNYVNFNGGVDRATTLTVERGMFLENITHEKFSYFNIVNIRALNALAANNGEYRTENGNYIRKDTDSSLVASEVRLNSPQSNTYSLNSYNLKDSNYTVSDMNGSKQENPKNGSIVNTEVFQYFLHRKMMGGYSENDVMVEE